MTVMRSSAGKGAFARHKFTESNVTFGGIQMSIASSKMMDESMQLQAQIG